MPNMEEFKVGDTIEHRLLPGSGMTVLAVRDCEGSPGQPAHKAYKVIDPEGGEDWLCGLIDAQRPGQNLPWGVPDES